jgi:protocatechuate 3,4-dioxygenase alpha subunit
MSEPALPLADGGERDLIAAPSQTVGPFFHFGVCPDEGLGVLAESAVGEPLHLRIRAFDGAGMPLPDSMIEIYQANAGGEYGAKEFSGFGRLATHPDGACVFETIRPGRVAAADGQRQAAHINVCLFARGLLRHLYTRVYFAGDPDLENDPLLCIVPADRRATLLASPAAGPSGSWEWEIHLQGARETVFFDL